MILKYFLFLQINQQIEDLINTLASIRQSFGESLPSAIHTSEAFMQFEKTVEVRGFLFFY